MLSEYSFIELLNPEKIIQYGGLTILIFIIFAETGLFFGFFLPGDSLLFAAGLMCNTPFVSVHVSLLVAILVIAATTGSTVGYGFGRWAQSYLQNRRENFFYRRRYLEMAKDFYRRYGMMAFIMGRFLPVVRTFVPILAGMVRINFKKFMIFNFVGAFIWVATMVLAGYWLGNLFPDIIDYLEFIVAGMVIVTAVPVIISWFRSRGIKS